jgi:hypothetical protein
MCAAIQHSCLHGSELPSINEYQKTVITRSLAHDYYRPLFMYLRGADLAHEHKVPEEVDDEKKARYSLQRLVRSHIPDDKSWKEILTSVDAARAQLLCKEFHGTRDVVSNSLVGGSGIGISSLHLFPYASLHPTRIPKEIQGRWGQPDELSCRNPEISRAVPSKPLHRVCEEEYVPPRFYDLRFPSVKIDSSQIELIVRDESGNVMIQMDLRVPVLIEAYEEKATDVTQQDIDDAVQKTLKEKESQILDLHRQKELGKLSSEEIAKILSYTIVHMVSSDGKASKVEGRLCGEDPEPFQLSYFCPRDQNQDNMALFLNQNLERICREVFAFFLQKPLARATLSEIKNILTIIPVRIEQEWELCFSKEKTSRISLTMAFPIDGVLWLANVGECKTFAVLQESVIQLGEDTFSTTHAIGARDVSPRAKVTTFFNQIPGNKLQAIIQGTKALTSKLIADSYDGHPGLNLSQRFQSLSNHEGIEFKVVEFSP